MEESRNRLAGVSKMSHDTPPSGELVEVFGAFDFCMNGLA
jgi:hypothetical protein